MPTTSLLLGFSALISFRTHSVGRVCNPGQPSWSVSFPPLALDLISQLQTTLTSQLTSRSSSTSFPPPVSCSKSLCQRNLPRSHSDFLPYQSHQPSADSRNSVSDLSLAFSASCLRKGVGEEVGVEFGPQCSPHEFRLLDAGDSERAVAKLRVQNAPRGCFAQLGFSNWRQVSLCSLNPTSFLDAAVCVPVL